MVPVDIKSAVITSSPPMLKADYVVNLDIFDSDLKALNNTSLTEYQDVLFNVSTTLLRNGLETGLMLRIINFVYAATDQSLLSGATTNVNESTVPTTYTLQNYLSATTSSPPPESTESPTAAPTTEGESDV